MPKVEKKELPAEEQPVSFLVDDGPIAVSETEPIKPVTAEPVKPVDQPVKPSIIMPQMVVFPVPPLPATAIVTDICFPPVYITPKFITIDITGKDCGFQI